MRVTQAPKASKEWQRIEAEKVSAWVRRLGWRVCIANGLAELRRSPRANGAKVRQETVSGPKGMAGRTSGVDQTKTKPKMEKERKTEEARRRAVTTENGQ